MKTTKAQRQKKIDCMCSLTSICAYHKSIKQKEKIDCMCSLTSICAYHKSIKQKEEKCRCLCHQAKSNLNLFCGTCGHKFPDESQQVQGEEKCSYISTPEGIWCAYHDVYHWMQTQGEGITENRDSVTQNKSIQQTVISEKPESMEEEIAKIVREYYFEITPPQEQRNRDIHKKLLALFSDKLKRAYNKGYLDGSVDMFIKAREVHEKLQKIGGGDE